MAWQRTVIATLATLALCAGAVPGQIIRYDPRGAEVGTTFQGVWRGLVTGESFTSQYYSEWVELGFAGEVADPRIFHYTLRISPTLSQQSVSSFSDDLRTRNIHINFAGTLFQAGRAPISLVATRSSGIWRGGTTGDREHTQSSLGASLWYNNRWLPVRLGVGRRSTRGSWRTNGTPPIRQDERIRDVRVTAANRKLELRFDRQSFEDRIFGLTYTTEDRSALHTLRWGKGSRLVTSLESLARAGFGAYTVSLWREQLHIQHTGTASSDLFYTRRRSRAGRQPVLGQDYGGSSQAGIRWFQLGVGWNAGTTEFEGGRSKRQSLAPSLGVSLPLPLGGVFTANGFSGIETLSIEATEGGNIDVLDERQEVPELRGFFLDQRFIDPATVVVRSEDQAIQYLVDRDYRLIEAGSLLRVVIPLGSRIDVGDVLLVSYRHGLVGEGEERARKEGYRAALRLGGFSVRRSEQRRSMNKNNEDGVTGLFDTYEALTTVGLRQATPVGRFLLEASRSKRRGPTYSDVTEEVRANYTATLGPAAAFLSASASRSRSDMSELTSVFGSGGFATRLSTSLELKAQVDAWRFRQDGALIEGTAIGSVTANWRFGSMDTEWRWEHIRRENGTFGTENRVWARVVRRF